MAEATAATSRKMRSWRSASRSARCSSWDLRMRTHQPRGPWLSERRGRVSERDAMQDGWREARARDSQKGQGTSEGSLGGIDGDVVTAQDNEVRDLDGLGEGFAGLVHVGRVGEDLALDEV